MRYASEFTAVGSETLPWQPSYDIETLSRPGRDAPPPHYQAPTPPKTPEVRFELPSPLAADPEDAAAAIIKLDTYVSARSGGEDIAPMQSVLLRSESAASSQIENLTVGARQLAIAELGGAASKNAELVPRNVRAMNAAIRHSVHLDTDSILAMHHALLADK